MISRLSCITADNESFLCRGARTRTKLIEAEVCFCFAGCGQDGCEGLQEVGLCKECHLDRGYAEGQVRHSFGRLDQNTCEYSVRCSSLRFEDGRHPESNLFDLLLKRHHRPSKRRRNYSRERDVVPPDKQSCFEVLHGPAGWSDSQPQHRSVVPRAGFHFDADERLHAWNDACVLAEVWRNPFLQDDRGKLTQIDAETKIILF